MPQEEEEEAEPTRTEALARVPRPPGATRRPRTSGAAAGSQRCMPSRPTLQPLERRGRLRDDDKQSRHGRGDHVCSAFAAKLG